MSENLGKGLGLAGRVAGAAPAGHHLLRIFGSPPRKLSVHPRLILRLNVAWFAVPRHVKEVMRWLLLWSLLLFVVVTVNRVVSISIRVFVEWLCWLCSSSCVVAVRVGVLVAVCVCVVLGVANGFAHGLFQQRNGAHNNRKQVAAKPRPPAPVPRCHVDTPCRQPFERRQCFAQRATWPPAS